jgi:uncharacterized phage protein (TIGR01671 family)
MNREIKFKYYFKIQSREGFEINKVVFNLEQIQERIFTGKKEDCIAIEQFTGLKDKNGVDIYEGDIIEFHGNYTSLEKCGRGKIGVVTWSLDYMRFDLIVENLGIYDVASETDEWHYKRLVIGNIHENKN